MAKKSSGRPQEQQNISTSSAGTAAQTSNGNANASGGMGDGAQTSDGSLSSDEIAARAYEIYEREGRSDGRDMDHWLRAETELRAERQLRQAGPLSRQDLPRSARQHQPATAV